MELRRDQKLLLIIYMKEFGKQIIENAISNAEISVHAIKIIFFLMMIGNQNKSLIYANF